VRCDATWVPVSHYTEAYRSCRLQRGLKVVKHANYGADTHIIFGKLCVPRFWFPRSWDTTGYKIISQWDYSRNLSIADLSNGGILFKINYKHLPRDILFSLPVYGLYNKLVSARRLAILTEVSMVFLSPCRQMPEYCLKLYHDRFLPHPCQFIFQPWPFHSTLYSLSYWESIVKLQIK
jgi:hypothetical protein